MTTSKSGTPKIVLPDPPAPEQESSSDNPKPKGNKKKKSRPARKKGQKLT